MTKKPFRGVRCIQTVYIYSLGSAWSGQLLLSSRGLFNSFLLSLHPTPTQDMSEKSAAPACGCQCDLLLWKNPVKTGKYFLGSLVVLLFFKRVNIFTCLLRILYTVFLTTASLEFVSKLLFGQGVVTKYGIKECPNTVAAVKPYVDELLRQLPVQQARMRMLVFAYVPKNTFKAAVATYVLHKVFSWFPLWTVLFVGDLFLFTMPIVYRTYQTEIDAAVQQGCKLVKARAQCAGKKLCDAVEPHIRKCPPLNKIIQNCAANNKKTATANDGEATASTTSAQQFPDVPEHTQETHEFNVDDLKQEIQESTDTLQQEFQKHE
ncbi:Rtn1p KNAG_0A04250 [Huiozyma naganishii CBS 8797]|uniref:Reticulon-like protein n=1 Tax=Huiozyma naganishii (strain ATCC MYA-139 / BCRC 22969 / CBS 8797 / KCTC 17520 / NBRC 10181 / NCYC 3082 / Yp74L-3) TaxID=1071383 RepID=J7RTM9_HUIN7|nr:hypothetical protein KNAG_0A04250 [Kazachstania naganishii CBS 8797]CCK68102.1 hypothetical protein KNAG_0A04250 [Kazachstania naganishii CBS 8797]